MRRTSRLVEELAARAALALSNAHLYAAAQRSRQRNEQARVEASAASERSAFLAEAGVVLDQSLDFDTTLADLAHLSVPGLADWCSIDVPDANDRMRNVVIVHQDPDRRGGRPAHARSATRWRRTARSARRGDAHRRRRVPPLDAS